MLERREVGRHFPDHIAVTRPAEHDEALANMLGCLLQRALRFGGGFSVAADDQEEQASCAWCRPIAPDAVFDFPQRRQYDFEPAQSAGDRKSTRLTSSN